jgi:glycosyltransferase involved in cell wall biosynthesis
VPLLRFWGGLLAVGTSLLSDGVVCCSTRVARQFPRWTRTPVAVAYPPVGEEYAGGERDATRAGLGLEDAAPCVLVVGSISRGRGQDVALRALPHIRERFPGARLVIVGEPHPRPVDLAFADELRGLAARLGIEEFVVFASPVPDVADLYAAADIVVNPARVPEAFGRVAPEALMAGRPVVASRVGAVPEVIRDGADGLLVEPDNAESLAGAVALLMDDPALSRRLVDSGRRRVVDRFGTEQDIAAWRGVLKKVIP